MVNGQLSHPVEHSRCPSQIHSTKNSQAFQKKRLFKVDAKVPCFLILQIMCCYLQLYCKSWIKDTTNNQDNHLSLVFLAAVKCLKNIHNCLRQTSHTSTQTQILCCLILLITFMVTLLQEFLLILTLLILLCCPVTSIHSQLQLFLLHKTCKASLRKTKQNRKWEGTTLSAYSPQLAQEKNPVYP